MEIVRVGAAVVNQTPLDWQGNGRRIAALLEAAGKAKVAVTCFPELCISGYGCEDMFLSVHVAKESAAVLADLLPLTKNQIVVFGLPWLHRNQLYNCAVVVQDGAIVGVNPKRVLAREGVHYEPRWFSPWPFLKVDSTAILGSEVPFGDLRYQFGSFSMAIEICEEAWGGESSCLDHVYSGVELVLNPSASHFALGKAETRERLVTNWSRALKVNYCYANLVGLEAGRLIYDGGALLAEAGTLLARGPRFGFNDGSLTWVDFDMDRARVARLRGRSVRHQDSENEKLTHLVVGTPISPRPPVRGRGTPDNAVTTAHRGVVATGPAANGEVDDPTKERPASREEDLIHALMVGLIDYLRKSHAHGFIISLSGGVDSSTCAVAVAHMFSEALKMLGPDMLQRKLPQLRPIGKPTDVRSWISGALTCVYQKSENSGAATHRAARELAETLGASFVDVEIDTLVADYQRELTRATGRKLSWDNPNDDLVLQNIQARVRAPMAWLLANVKNALLLTTSNRSEAAVGYATMDGDTAGGLAPLGGVDKKTLRQFLRWLEHQREIGLGELPVLKQVNEMAPTAELRPPELCQTDETDLMPYDVLASLERYFVADKMTPDEMNRALVDEFPKIDPATVFGYVQKFHRLWRVSQWKRERLAPSFQLDDISVDPKTWFRYPILSGPEFEP